jgi:hypothetical protein
MVTDRDKHVSHKVFVEIPLSDHLPPILVKIDLSSHAKSLNIPSIQSGLSQG